MSEFELSKEEKLVFIKKEDVFTNSKIVAEHAGIQHHAVQKITDKYKSDFEEFGKLKYKNLKCEYSRRGRPEKIYLYNEQQATLLLTYLKNTKTVREFKKALVKQFYEAKKKLEEIQAPEYKAIRAESKEVTKSSMKLLKDSIINIDQTQYIKANTIANKATSIKFGIKKMIKVEEMTKEMIKFRNKVIQRISALMEAQSLGVEIPHISEIIYKNIK